MMGKGEVQVLLIQPGRASGCAVAIDGVARRPLAFHEAVLPNDGADLRPSVAALGELIGRMLPESGESGGVAVAFDGCWAISGRTRLPPGRDAEVREFLRLWVERQWPPAVYGNLRWGWQEIGTGAAREAFVVLLREDLVLPVEELAASRGIPLRLATLPELLLAGDLCHEAPSGAYIRRGPRGFSMLGMCGGSPDALGFLPLAVTAVDSPLARHHLSQFIGPGARRVWCSNADAVPSEDPGWRGRLPAAWMEGAPPGLAEERAILWTLAEKVSAPEGLPNFVNPSGGGNALAGRIQVLLDHPRVRRAVPSLWVAAGLLLLAVWLLGSRIEASAKAAAETISLDEPAANSNIEILRKLEQERRPILSIMEELQKAKGSVTIERFEMDQKSNVVLSGKCASFAEIESFAVRLNQSRRFAGAVTQAMSRVNDREVTFTIRCRAEVSR